MEKNWFVGGDEVDTIVDAPLQVFLLVYGPGIGLQAQVVALLNPFRVCLKHFVVIVHAGSADFLQFLWWHFAIQVINFSAFRRIFDEFAHSVWRECDVGHAVLQFVVLHQSEGFHHTHRLLDKVGVRLHFEHHLNVGVLGEFLQILVESADVFTIRHFLTSHVLGK